MADSDDKELVDINSQYKALDMEHLIAAPLIAACKAEKQMAGQIVDFIQTVGFGAGGKTGTGDNASEQKIQTLDFSFTRASSQSGMNGTENVKMSVPLLSVVKVPSFAIDSMDVVFDMEVKSSVEHKNESSESVDTHVSGNVGFAWWKAGVDIKGSVSCHQEHTRRTDNSAKYHIAVHARDFGMPEGLARVMDVLASAAAPQKIEG